MFGEKESRKVLEDPQAAKAKRNNAAFQLAWLKRIDRAIDVLRQSEEQLLLYFPPAAGYYELLDVRSDFSDAPRLMVALLDYQQGVRSRPLPPELDPRRGGD